MDLWQQATVALTALVTAVGAVLLGLDANRTIRYRDRWQQGPRKRAPVDHVGPAEPRPQVTLEEPEQAP